MRKERQGVQFIAATRTHNKYFHSSEYWLQNTEKEPDAEHKSKLLNLLFTNNHMWMNVTDICIYTKKE